MSGRFVVLVVAAIGWVLAALVAFAIVSLFGFFGVGFLGLLLLFICTQVELESDASSRLFAPQAQARQNMPRAERASHGQPPAGKTTRLFRSIGIGLTLIGFGGFLYFQLGLFDP
jgi:hypothetical protein